MIAPDFKGVGEMKVDHISTMKDALTTVHSLQLRERALDIKHVLLNLESLSDSPCLPQSLEWGTNMVATTKVNYSYHILKTSSLAHLSAGGRQLVK